MKTFQLMKIVALFTVLALPYLIAYAVATIGEKRTFQDLKQTKLLECDKK
jgi:hypothetical protein